MTGSFQSCAVKMSDTMRPDPICFLRLSGRTPQPLNEQLAFFAGGECVGDDLVLLLQDPGEVALVGQTGSYQKWPDELSPPRDKGNKAAPGREFLPSQRELPG